MKTKSICLLALLCGIISYGATPRVSSAPKYKSMAIAAPAQPHFIVFIWQSEYQGMTNVETVIDGSTGLLLPAWKEKFHGCTNTCRLPATNSSEFFRAYSRFIGETNN